MTDTTVETVQLREAWTGLGHRLAVAGGCLIGLISLFHHVPASTASLRGAGLYIAIRVIAKWGLIALERAIELSPEGQEPSS